MGAVVTNGAQVSHSIKSMKHDIAEGQMFEELKKQGATKKAKTQKALAAMDVIANEMLAARGKEAKVSGKRKKISADVVVDKYYTR